ncbi:MAG: L-aspartate oxidase [Acidobacteriota bacterium]|nr:L-aspartate oxidase [Acidobacteriota bacterium]
MSPVRNLEFLVIGAGVAGLRAAVELADHGSVLVATKEAMAESNTWYAQGGIAVASDDEGDTRLHLEDTIAAGDGLVYRAAAQVLVEEGPQRVAELIEWGARFDRDRGRLLRTREGAHSRPRILHANGDATGAEISRSLIEFAHAHPRIQFAEWTTATALLKSGNQITGAQLLARDGTTLTLHARAILIATGGAGQVYSETTNPPVATGDGIAIAAEAGAYLADMEFYQFHPTAFALHGAPRFLMSEALRGEGAYLRNQKGERFMERYHPLLELAPRDVVARAIARESIGDDGEIYPAFLDLRHIRNIDLHQRFPGISSFLAQHSLDIARDLIPVLPAAHYLMGGIKTDLDGRTTMPGLYAAGEAACTGVHGANRLASNSLLEGLVFGARAARAMLCDTPSSDLRALDESFSAPATTSTNGADTSTSLAQLVPQLRHSMWNNAGLLREESTLRTGLTQINSITNAIEELAGHAAPSRLLAEARSLCCVASAILNSALARTESRGAHFRTDFPAHDDAQFAAHSIFSLQNAVHTERW